MWYLYVLHCRDNSFYTGITTDVARRVAEHQAGAGARYTRSHLPVELLAAWQYPDQSAAAQAEYQFKALTHNSKAAWIEGRWPFMGGPFAYAVLNAEPVKRFCPRCGGSLIPQSNLEPDKSEPFFICSLCGQHHYRNAKPAAGALILRPKAEVLLVKRAYDPYRGYWDIPGGFLAEEELPQAAAAREVYEETGLTLHALEFFGFYLDRYEFQLENYSILNIYFLAEATGKPCPGDDAVEIASFPLAALPERLAFEHARRVLTDLRAELNSSDTA